MLARTIAGSNRLTSTSTFLHQISITHAWIIYLGGTLAQRHYRVKIYLCMQGASTPAPIRQTRVASSHWLLGTPERRAVVVNIVSYVINTLRNTKASLHWVPGRSDSVQRARPDTSAMNSAMTKKSPAKDPLDAPPRQPISSQKRCSLYL